MSYMEQTLHDLRRHEGCRLKSYKDTEGIWTIGYGHTKGVYEGMQITQKQADEWLLADTILALNIARKVVKGFNNLSPVRKGVMINMAFNLGEPRLRGFRKTLALIEVSRWQEAALEMLDSKWATQVKGRATELARRMSTDTILPQHKLTK